MRRWSFESVLATSALALVGAAVVTLTAVAWNQASRLVDEEARVRAERAIERAVDARERGLDPELFEVGTGIEVAVRRRAEIDAAAGDPRLSVWSRALESGSASAVLPGAGGAVAARRIDGGDLLEAQMPPEVVYAPLRRLAAGLVTSTLAIGGLAAFAAVLLGRQLARPLGVLARAAERIGEGQLDRPLPEFGGAEVGALARTLEQMRRRLAAATGELEHRRAEMETILSGVAEGVVAVDRDRRVRFASPPAAQRLGIQPEEAVGRFCGDLLRPEPVRGVRPCEEDCPLLHARFRGPSRAVERLCLPDGGAVPFVLSASPPRDGLQVLILREETPVEAAGRARDVAVAELAHELQTPLAAQYASLELLRDRLSDSDRGALELVLGLETGGVRLRRLIDNLLESVRIESGQLAVRRVPLDVATLIEEAVELARPLAERRGQRIEQRIEPELPQLTGDPQRIAQVLTNLLANASKYGPDGSVLRVGAGRVHDAGASRIEIWVEDDGPGVPPEVAREPGRFRRGASEPREEGSGLGLWICRSIVERHGGELRLERRGDRTRAAAHLPVEGVG